jgi:hypothetical protein
MDPLMVFLWRIGCYPTLLLTGAEVRALSEDDERELREDFDATDRLIEQLRRLAREDDGPFRLDFEAQAVTVGA